jgi:hypothetical protein
MLVLDAEGSGSPFHFRFCMPNFGEDQLTFAHIHLQTHTPILIVQPSNPLQPQLPCFSKKTSPSTTLLFLTL